MVSLFISFPGMTLDNHGESDAWLPHAAIRSGVCNRAATLVFRGTECSGSESPCEPGTLGFRVYRCLMFDVTVSYLIHARCIVRLYVVSYWMVIPTGAQSLNYDGIFNDWRQI